MADEDKIIDEGIEFEVLQERGFYF